MNDQKRNTAYNSTYPKGGVSCSKDSFVVNGSLVFQIKFCAKLKFCASIAPPSQSPETLAEMPRLIAKELL